MAGEWDELHAIHAEHAPEVWNSARPAFLYGLQADAVAAILGALQARAAIKALAEGDEAVRVTAIVHLLRRQNVGWRVNNPWNGFTDHLQYKPFALAEEGGIGIDDIVKDSVVNKAVLQVLDQFARRGKLHIDAQIATGITRAFDSGLGVVLEKLVQRDLLADAVRSNPVPVEFTIETILAQIASRQSSHPAPEFRAEPFTVGFLILFTVGSVLALMPGLSELFPSLPQTAPSLAKFGVWAFKLGALAEIPANWSLIRSFWTKSKGHGGFPGNKPLSGGVLEAA
jgi:hypothetical protein